jgi:excisionase family DNA binding protein
VQKDDQIMPTHVRPPRPKFAWSVEDWCNATSVSRSKAYELMKQNALRFVKLGDRRLIVEHPEDFLAKLRG